MVCGIFTKTLGLYFGPSRTTLYRVNGNVELSDVPEKYPLLSYPHRHTRAHIHILSNTVLPEATAISLINQHPTHYFQLYFLRKHCGFWWWYEKYLVRTYCYELHILGEHCNHRKEGLKVSYRKSFNRITLIAWSTIAVIFLMCSIILNNAQAKFLFKASIEYGAGVEPRSVAIGDLNGDANPDLAVANEGSDNVSVLINEIQVVNYLVTFEPDPSTYEFIPDTAACPSGFGGKIFDAALTNIIDEGLANLLVEVTDLTNGNLLLTDIGLIEQGERFGVPKNDD